MPAVLEAGGRARLLEQVESHVLDDRHVFGAMAAAQAGEVVLEHDIQDPMQPIFHMPMRAHGPAESLGIELDRAWRRTSMRP